jgi:hypothetical protein
MSEDRVCTCPHFTKQGVIFPMVIDRDCPEHGTKQQSHIEECRERDIREFEEWWFKSGNNQETPTQRALFGICGEVWLAARGHK